MKIMEGNWFFKLKQVIYFFQRNFDILDDGMEGKKKVLIGGKEIEF